MKPLDYVFDEPTHQRQEQRKREARRKLAEKIWTAVHAAITQANSTAAERPTKALLTDRLAIAAIERVLEEHENGR